MAFQVSQVMSPNYSENHCERTSIKLEDLVLGRGLETKPCLVSSGGATAIGTRQHLGNSSAGSCHSASSAEMVVDDELVYLKRSENGLQRPAVAILGGSVEDRQLEVLRCLVGELDQVLVCGRLAQSVLNPSVCKLTGDGDIAEEIVTEAKRIQREAEEKGCKLIFPMDWTYNGLSEEDCVGSTAEWEEAAPSKHRLLEIGPRSTSSFADIISRAKTLIWHGPSGVRGSGVSLASTGELFEAMAAMCKGGGAVLLGDGSVEIRTTRWCLQRQDRELRGNEEAVGSLVTEGVLCSVQSNNFVVQTLDEPFPSREGSEPSVVSQIRRRSCGDEDRPIKERYFLEPAPNPFMDREGLTSQPFRPPKMGDPDSPAKDGNPQHTAASSSSWLGSDGFMAGGSHDRSSGVLCKELFEHKPRQPEPPGSSHRASLVRGDTDGVGVDDSNGVRSHKTRGEVTDPTNPVFSVATSPAKVPPTDLQSDPKDLINDFDPGQCIDVMHEGHGVKAVKYTIPAPAIPSYHQRPEVVQDLEPAGGQASTPRV